MGNWQQAEPVGDDLDNAIEQVSSALGLCEPEEQAAFEKIKTALLANVARAAQSGQRAGMAKSEIDARLRAAGFGALLSEVYARASGLLEEEQCERIEQALMDYERAIAAAPTPAAQGGDSHA